MKSYGTHETEVISHVSCCFHIIVLNFDLTRFGLSEAMLVQRLRVEFDILNATSQIKIDKEATKWKAKKFKIDTDIDKNATKWMTEKMIIKSAANLARARVAELTKQSREEEDFSHENGSQILLKAINM